MAEPIDLHRQRLRQVAPNLFADGLDWWHGFPDVVRIIVERHRVGGSRIEYVFTSYELGYRVELARRADLRDVFALAADITSFDACCVWAHNSRNVLEDQPNGGRPA
jgi:hypothetical protein